MNAFSSVKQAFYNIPGFRRVLTKPEPWESEFDPYNREILRQAQTLMSTDPGVKEEEKIDALKQIGHIAYIGGQSAAKCATEFMPFLFDCLKNSSTPRLLKLQILRSLCEIGHRNKVAQQLLAQDEAVLEVFADIISDVTQVRECRWACYTLLILIADEVMLLNKVKATPSIQESLDLAAEFPIPWFAWGCNLANLLLKILGHVDPRTKTQM